MADLLEKCEVCRALLDEEDLFCANCGREAPHQAPEQADRTVETTHNFACGGCGASMSYDADAQTLRCPFCGSERLEKQADAKTLAPRRVAPFVVSQSQAQAVLRKALGSGFWRPSDLSQAAVVTKMSAVYVPYWVFRANTHTYWTADSSHTPMGARGDWYPLTGEHRASYQGILVGASGALTANETAAICPFDLATATPPEEIDLSGAIVEQFRVQRKYARVQARSGLEEMERQACTRYVPGRARNVQVNLRLEGLSSEPMLLPVWVMAYRYKGKLYRFLLNGQSGKAHGEAPFSWAKLLMVLGIAAAVVIGVLLLIGLAGGLAALF